MTQPAPDSSTRPSTFAEPGRTSDHAASWRYEFKYVLPGHLRAPLTRDLRAFVDPDAHAGPNGFYLVRSLYLDSPDWYCFHEKNAGLPRRHKLRVRGYVTGNKVTAPIKLEIKQRDASKIRKHVASLGLEEYRALMPALHDARRIDPSRVEGNPTLSLFFHLKHTGGMKPVLNVQFRRQAFVARTDRRCRITIDDRLTARRSRDLFDTMTAAPSLLGQGNAVLEIKVAQTIPFWTLRLIRKYHLQLASISKYGYAAMSGPFGLDAWV